MTRFGISSNHMQLTNYLMMENQHKQKSSSYDVQEEHQGESKTLNIIKHKIHKPSKRD